MDISHLVTKKDLERLENRLEARFNARFTTFEAKINTTLEKLQNTLDGFVGVVDDLRTDNTVGTHHTRELQMKVEEHDKRLTLLESARHTS